MVGRRRSRPGGSRVSNNRAAAAVPTPKSPTGPPRAGLPPMIAGLGIADHAGANEVPSWSRCARLARCGAFHRTTIPLRSRTAVPAVDHRNLPGGQNHRPLEPFNGSPVFWGEGMTFMAHIGLVRAFMLGAWLGEVGLARLQRPPGNPVA